MTFEKRHADSPSRQRMLLATPWEGSRSLRLALQRALRLAAEALLLMARAVRLGDLDSDPSYANINASSVPLHHFFSSA